MAKMIYSYDAESREIGFQQYGDGKLSIEYTNYQYDGLNLTYNYNGYFGNEKTVHKEEKIFLNDKYVKYKSYIRYLNDDTISEYLYFYDTDEREIGYKSLSNGDLFTEYSNYQYNGLTSTYKYSSYYKGNTTQKYFVKIDYLY